MEECALATGLVAALEGKIWKEEVIALTYIRSAQYNQTLTLGPGDVKIDTYAVHQQCLAEGIVQIRVQCYYNQCMNIRSKRIMNAEEAIKLTRVYVNDRKVRSLQETVHQSDEEEVLGWESNLFYQLVKYSARQVSQRACITCYNSKRLPEIKPIPGIKEETCSNKSTCFAYCATVMASWESITNMNWTKNTSICPQRVDNELNTWTPSLTKITKKIKHPFCITRGQEMKKKMAALNGKLQQQTEKVALKLKGTTMNNLSDLGIVLSVESEDGLRLDYRWLRMPEQGRVKHLPSSMPYFIYSTTNTAAIQCEQVIIDQGLPLIVMNNNRYYSQFILPSLDNGTRPLADIFWPCDDNQQVKVTLMECNGSGQGYAHQLW